MVSGRAQKPVNPGVLVPRPARDPDRFAALLREAGFDPLSLAVMEIVPLAGQSPGLKRALGADAVIFVSGNAVDCCMDLLADAGMSFPVAVPCFAVGRSSAEALRYRGIEAGFPAHRADSEGLLDFPALNRVRGKRILVCRGQGGREKLPETLRARGAEVTILELYERVPIGDNAEAINRLINEAQVPVVAIHSGEILSAFLQILTPAARRRLPDLVFLTPGKRMANLLGEEGIPRVVEASGALPEQMVEALVRWYTRD